MTARGFTRICRREGSRSSLAPPNASIPLSRSVADTSPQPPNHPDPPRRGRLDDHSAQSAVLLRRRLLDDSGPEKHQRDGYTRSGLRALLTDSGIEVNEHRHTLVFFAELLMGVTKLAYSISSGKRELESQAEVLQVKDSALWTIWRMLFPVFTLMARTEDVLLAPWARGHLLPELPPTTYVKHSGRTEPLHLRRSGVGHAEEASRVPRRR